MVQNEAESEDYQNPASESVWPVPSVRPSAAVPPGLTEVAVVAIQTIAVLPVSVHGKGNKSSKSCFPADQKGGSGKGHRKDYSDSPNITEVNKSWNLAMKDMPPRAAAAKIKARCSFFQRGLCRFGNLCEDLHDHHSVSVAPFGQETKEQNHTKR